MEKFAIGVLLGGLAGALLVANNYKMRTLVKKGQEEVQAKFNKMMDEKIQMMEEGTETLKEKTQEIKEKAEEKIEDLTDKKSRKAKRTE